MGGKIDSLEMQKERREEAEMWPREGALRMIQQKRPILGPRCS